MLGGLPGLGSRSARRIALHLLTHKIERMMPLARAISDAAEAIHTCPDCGNLDTVAPCRICLDEKRDRSLLCVVASVSDLWAIERTHAYRGLYHVLGGVLSALDGVGVQNLDLDRLPDRTVSLGTQEVILALSATVDGQSTAHYITDLLAAHPATGGIRVTRLAHGVPVGGELDYLDDGTIMTAMNARGRLL